jgi:hypothetical protein
MATADQFGLTEAEWHFVRLYASYGRGDWAAREAGYAASQAEALLRDSRIDAAVTAETRRKLQQGAVKALRRVEKLMDDSSVSDNVRLQAAKDWMDRAGYKPEFNFEDAGRKADRRSRDELLGEVKKMQQKLGIEGPVDLGEAEVVEQESSDEAEKPALPPTEDAPQSEEDIEEAKDALEMVETFNVDPEDLDG